MSKLLIGILIIIGILLVVTLTIIGMSVKDDIKEEKKQEEEQLPTIDDVEGIAIIRASGADNNGKNRRYNYYTPF